jgi:hypothetical protein
MPRTRKRQRKPGPQASSPATAAFLAALEHDRRVAAAALLAPQPEALRAAVKRPKSVPRGYAMREDGRLFRLPQGGDLQTRNSQTDKAQAATAGMKMRCDRQRSNVPALCRVFALSRTLIARETGCRFARPRQQHLRRRNHIANAAARVDRLVAACALRRDVAGVAPKASESASYGVPLNQPALRSQVKFVVGNAMEGANRIDKWVPRSAGVIQVVRPDTAASRGAATVSVGIFCPGFETQCGSRGPSMLAGTLLLGDRRGRVALVDSTDAETPLHLMPSAGPCASCHRAIVHHSRPCLGSSRPSRASGFRLTARSVQQLSGVTPAWSLSGQVQAGAPSTPHGACTSAKKSRQAASLLPAAVAWTACPDSDAMAYESSSCLCAKHALGAKGWLFWAGDCDGRAACWDIRHVGHGPVAIFRGYASQRGRWASTAAVTPCCRFLVVCKPIPARLDAGSLDRDCSGVSITVWDALRGGWPLAQFSPTLASREAGLARWDVSAAKLPMGITCDAWST